jgi:hypothetical protein
MKWDAFGCPFPEELIPIIQVLEPVSERLQREVSVAPCSWNYVLLKGLQDILAFL